MILLNEVQKSFLNCTIYMTYAMDIMYLFCVRIIASIINLPLHVECYKIFFAKDVLNP